MAHHGLTIRDCELTDQCRAALWYSDHITIENTKLELDVNGEPFVASGDVLVTPGFREAYPYGLKRDEQIPPLEQGDTVDVFDIKLEAKQTEPPARYSQGKLVQ